MCDINPSVAPAKVDTDFSDPLQLKLCQAGTVVPLSHSHSFIHLVILLVMCVVGLSRALAIQATVYILGGRFVQKFWSQHSGFQVKSEFTCGKLSLQLVQKEQRQCLLVLAPHPCAVHRCAVALLCCALLCFALLCFALLCCAVLCFALLCLLDCVSVLW